MPYDFVGDYGGEYSMNVLLNSGVGYIGSYMAIELMSEGYDVVILDNLLNSDSPICLMSPSLTSRM